MTTLLAVIHAHEPMWTDVLQAVGTVVGAFVTAIAVVVAGLAFRHEVRSRNRELRDAEAAQARLILFRFRGSNRNQGGSTDVIGEVMNASEKPIRSVKVHVAARADPTNSATHNASIVSASAEHRFRVGLPRLTADRKLAKELTVTVQFEDATGLIWKRTDNGPPERVIEQPAPVGPKGPWWSRLGARLRAGRGATGD